MMKFIACFVCTIALTACGSDKEPVVEVKLQQHQLEFLAANPQEVIAPNPNQDSAHGYGKSCQYTCHGPM